MKSPSFATRLPKVNAVCSLSVIIFQLLWENDLDKVVNVKKDGSLQPACSLPWASCCENQQGSNNDRPRPS